MSNNKQSSVDKDFVPYEEALALKELGFNEPCFGLYAPPSKTVFLHHYGLLSAKEQILAPTFSQAFRWFREKYGLVHCIGNPDLYPIKGENFHIGIGVNPIVFEEAELECLKKLIEILNQNK